MRITTTGEFLSPEEVGDRLGVSVYTVRRWINAGALNAYKPGRDFLIAEDDLRAFLEVHRTSPGKAPSPSLDDALLGVVGRSAALPERIMPNDVKTVAEVLQDGLGHAYMAYSLPETVEEAEQLTIPQIMTRLQDLSAERKFLDQHTRKAGGRENEEVRRLVRRQRRRVQYAFEARVRALIEVGIEKQRATDLPEDEKSREIEALKTEAERILEQSGAPA